MLERTLEKEVCRILTQFIQGLGLYIQFTAGHRVLHSYTDNLVPTLPQRRVERFTYEETFLCNNSRQHKRRN